MKKPEHDGFGRLAPLYDSLAGFIFAGKIKQSQIHFLSRIPSHGNILILGGGTGWIIAKILKVKPNANICFVDSSQGMIHRARKQYASSTQIKFIYGTISEIPTREFDIIMLPFFLDMFPDSSLIELISVISKFSTTRANWLVTDFMNHGKRWQGALLFMMYRFFRFTCKIEAVALPDWPSALRNAGLERIELKRFYYGFIESSVYHSVKQE